MAFFRRALSALLLLTLLLLCVCLPVSGEADKHSCADGCASRIVANIGAVPSASTPLVLLYRLLRLMSASRFLALMLLSAPVLRGLLLHTAPYRALPRVLFINNPQIAPPSARA
jgi:hypothetical protein